MSTTSQPSIHLFTVSPRSTDPADYWTNSTRVFEFTERHGYSGTLIFTGNDTFVEPWVAAQHLLTTTKHLIPLIAVNPLYMHPFTTAKMISSFAYVYGRPVYLNMVTGAAISYLRSLGDQIGHDERYDRIGEYIRILNGLLTQPRFSLAGRFYQLDQVQLAPRPKQALLPRFLLSGQSPPALTVADATGACSMQMLHGELAKGVRPGVRGIHFGIITRPTEAEAWSVARSLFPEDLEAQMMLELSMGNTDSQWKQRMMIAAQQGTGQPGYWLEPFRNFKADCPYFVGSHAQSSALVRGLVDAGINTIVLDLPSIESEFEHASAVVASAGVRVIRADG